MTLERLRFPSVPVSAAILGVLLCTLPTRVDADEHGCRCDSALAQRLAAKLGVSPEVLDRLVAPAGGRDVGAQRPISLWLEKTETPDISSRGPTRSSRTARQRVALGGLIGAGMGAAIGAVTGATVGSIIGDPGDAAVGAKLFGGIGALSGGAAGGVVGAIGNRGTNRSSIKTIVLGVVAGGAAGALSGAAWAAGDRRYEWTEGARVFGPLGLAIGAATAATVEAILR